MLRILILLGSIFLLASPFAIAQQKSKATQVVSFAIHKPLTSGTSITALRVSVGENRSLGRMVITSGASTGAATISAAKGSILSAEVRSKPVLTITE